MENSIKKVLLNKLEIILCELGNGMHNAIIMHHPAANELKKQDYLRKLGYARRRISEEHNVIFSCVNLPHKGIHKIAIIFFPNEFPVDGHPFPVVELCSFIEIYYGEFHHNLGCIL